jgi:subtilisin family serine protease
MKTVFKIAPLCFALLAVVVSPTFAGTPQLASTVSGDTLRHIWVFFKDKDNRIAPLPVSARAELRRRKVGFRNSESDRPVNRNYIREVERRGGVLRTAFPWGNAASFSVSRSRVAEISSLPFVKAVAPVGVYINRKIDDGAGGLFKSKSTAAYGGYDWHTETVNVPLAHDYIRYKGLGVPGSGVRMAFFDGGFRLGHAVYKRLRENSQVIAAYDFVDGDTLVADPDSVANNPRHPYYQNDKHGSQTLAFAAAYAPGVYMGSAYGAAFALARTEDDGVESRAEEDNWMAAMVWADSVGADIISSSLGYRDGYTDSTENYSYPDMDGATALISLAAAEAIRRGMIVVSSMGNEGSHISGTLTAPADVDGVISVGALTKNRTLADFSSTGPTSDGRMKPEVVAPGYLMPAPDPYSTDRDGYTNVSGTSFSAPIVSAIMALILQAHPNISSQAAKERLYASCSFAVGQTAPNDKFGYGIPNAALAVMGAKEIFLKITDSAKKPLAGAVAMLNELAYTADTAGNILISAPTFRSGDTLRILISYRDSLLSDTIKVGALPFARVVDMDKKWDNGLKVAPNISRKDGVIRGRYTVTGANASTPIVATVSTITGKKVWRRKLRVRPDGTADFEWDIKNGGKGGGAASGVYLITVRHGYGMVCRRVVVSN